MKVFRSTLSFVHPQSKMFMGCFKNGFLRVGTRIRATQTIARFENNVRLAKISDIEKIDACNRATLPEHYTYENFATQLRCYPTLSLVAVSDDDELVREFVSQYLF
jgi:hypothetical protein